MIVEITFIKSTSVCNKLEFKKVFYERGHGEEKERLFFATKLEKNIGIFTENLQVS